MTAEKAAMASPKASSAGDFLGKDSPRPPSRFVLFGSCEDGVGSELRSTWDIRKTPTRLARTPISFRHVNFSVRVSALIRRVHTLEVDVRIVVEATVVYWRHDRAK